MSRGAIGWFVFRALARATGLAYWIAGPGEVERRIAALAWLEQRPVDYPARRDGLDAAELRRRRFARLDRDLERRRPW